jgi:hypothetical protein
MNENIVSLSEYLAEQGASLKNVGIYTRTNQSTGMTFFVLGFPQPGKTVISSRTGQEVEATLSVAVGQDTQKSYGLEGCDKPTFKKFVVEHFKSLKINKEASNTIPTAFIPNEKFDLE